MHLEERQATQHGFDIEHLKSQKNTSKVVYPDHISLYLSISDSELLSSKTLRLSHIHSINQLGNPSSISELLQDNAGV